MVSYDEVTRCLGMYDYLSQLIPCNYPPFNERAKDSTEGGCNGWYNPFTEEGSTPDYFHRLVDSSISPENDVDVPHNYYNNYGSMPHKQEAYDDNNNSYADYGSEDAYVGIWNRRKMNDTNSILNTSEYISQRFGEASHLLAGHYYHILFKVSWTLGADPENPNDYDYQTGHFLKGIGAFFTSTDPLPFSDHPIQYIFNIDDHDPDLIYDQNYFNVPKYYDSTGGSNGMNWMTVENYYRPSEDKNFITIGNFQKNWNIDNRVKDTNAVMRMPGDSIIMVYYFIDAVTVEEVPCVCSNTVGYGLAYNLISEPILKNPNDTSCCYKIYLKTTGMSKLTCRINKVKLYLNNSTSPFRTLTSEDSIDYFFQNDNNNILLDTLCFTNLENTIQNIKAELYYDNEIKCEFSDEFTVFCPCGCDTNASPNNFFDIKLIDYRRTENGSRCCWDIAVSNESACTLSVEEIYIDTSNARGSDLNINSTTSNWNVSNVSGRFVFSNSGDFGLLHPTLTDEIVGTICIDQSSTEAEPVHLSMYYKNSEGWCGNEFTADLLCPDCCLRVQTNVSPIAIIDDGARCCFDLNVIVDSAFSCGNDEIIIKIRPNTDSNQTFNIGNENFNRDSSYNRIFCVNQSLFKDSSLQLKIYVYDNQFNLLCVNPVTINKCQMTIPPCTPDYETTPWDSTWSRPIKFLCPGSIDSCTLSFYYYYRNVLDGNGNSLQRDVQVTAIKYSDSCSCESERIRQMLKYMWTNASVLSKFGISTIENSVWKFGTDTCFTNFRVITSDCWTSPAQTAGDYYTHRCPDVSCCYAVYQVCYSKDSVSGKIKIDTVSQLNGYEPDPFNCSPCVGGHCAKLVAVAPQPWLPRISINDSFSHECNVYIASSKDKQDKMLNLECEQKGNVVFQIFDLLGNEVSKTEINKTNYHASLPIDSKIRTGIYFLRVILNGSIIYSDKVSIVK